MSGQNTLDRMLTIAVWELVFGGGRASVWVETIASLVARGAKFIGDA